MTEEKRENAEEKSAAENDDSSETKSATSNDDAKSENTEAENSTETKVEVKDEAEVESRESSTNYMIEANGLSKFYGRFAAIQDVSFKIPAGQIVAFLGPNGAGKSTTMKILTGYLAPSKGDVKIAGIDVLHNRIEASRKIGYMPESGPLYTDMTPKGLLEFMADVRGIPALLRNDRIDAAIQLCQLEQVVEKPIGKLSKGYRQRVGMAQAFLHDPEVLILDEPTSGLDPNQIQGVRDNIRKAGAQKTILLSTHILQEVDAMADHVIFINEGRIVFNGPKSELGSDSKSMEQRFHELTGAQLREAV